MAANIQIGNDVFVPTSLLPNPGQYGTALTTRTVASIQGRKATLALPHGAFSPPIALSKLHVGLKVLVLRIGDYATEANLLDPLAKSVLHFLRLFIDDSFVQLLEVRSLDELAVWWGINANGYSHVVLIGHGDMAAGAIQFAVGGNKSAADFGAALGAQNGGMVFLSLACQSGKQVFSKPFSNLGFCSACIAPFHSVQGAVASQFCQSFFANHFVEGRSLSVAFKDARAATPGSTSFRLWRKGEMK